MTQRLAVSALAGVVLLAAGSGLTGCAAYNDVVHHFADDTYDDAVAARDALGPGAQWIPADAVEIRTRTSTRGDPDAVVQFVSGSPLDPELCAPGPRMSGAAWYFGDSPDVYTLTDAYVCGEWTAVATDDGWLGWTPNSAAERDAAGAAG
ncbi:hypothetical protein F6B41_14625 [Microbacterium lushaniae]|nr:hypothetical protein F6B41_29630 [Microbacterium lushaniae]KAA9153732.1 hypothetical protein F6B41_14625 [Microbacterium lushaniae]